MNLRQLLAGLEPGAMVSVYDHPTAVRQRYRVMWRRGRTVCLKLADQKHVTSRMLVIPEHDCVLEHPATIHFLNRRGTPTLTLTLLP